MAGLSWSLLIFQVTVIFACVVYVVYSSETYSLLDRDRRTKLTSLLVYQVEKFSTTCNEILKAGGSGSKFADGRNKRQLFSRLDFLGDDEVSFTGERDGEGFPNGHGAVRFGESLDNDPPSKGFSTWRGLTGGLERAQTGDLLSEVAGTFSHGRLVGPALLRVRGSKFVFSACFAEEGTPVGTVLEKEIGAGGLLHHVNTTRIVPADEREDIFWEVNEDVFAYRETKSGKRPETTTTATILLHKEIGECEPILVWKSADDGAKRKTVHALLGAEFSSDGGGFFRAASKDLEFDETAPLPLSEFLSDHLIEELEKVESDSEEEEDLLQFAYARRCQRIHRSERGYESAVRDPDKLWAELEKGEQGRIEDAEEFMLDLTEDLRESRLSAMRSTPGCPWEECARATRFVQWPPRGSVRHLMMPSYPASGSKWLLGVLQEATGIGSQTSVIDPLPASLSSARFGLLCKSHHSRRRFFSLRLLGGRALLLLRSPYDVVLSYWNHAHLGDPARGMQRNHSLTTEEMTRSIRADDARFSTFVLRVARSWERLALDWIGTAAEVEAVHYERVKEDWERELRRVLSFVRLSEDDIPDFPARLDCLRRCPLDSFKRRRKEDGNGGGGLDIPRDIFSGMSEEARERMEAAVEKVDQALGRRGLQELPRELYQTYDGVDTKRRKEEL